MDNSLEPMVILEKTLPLSSVYDGYVTHDVPCHSPHARVIFVEAVEQEKMRYLVLQVLDRGFVSKTPEYAMRIVVYDRMGTDGVTPLGPNPGELLGVVRTTREPFAFYVFLLRAPRAREKKGALHEAPVGHVAPTSPEESHQPVGLRAAPTVPDPPAPEGLVAQAQSPDDELDFG